MTNIQLFLSVGIPSLLVILSWLSNNSRADRTDKRIEAVAGRVEAVAGRVDALAAQTHSDMLTLLRAMTDLHERVAKVETRQGM